MLLHDIDLEVEHNCRSKLGIQLKPVEYFEGWLVISDLAYFFSLIVHKSKARGHEAIRRRVFV